MKTDVSDSSMKSEVVDGDRVPPCSALVTTPSNSVQVCSSETRVPPPQSTSDCVCNTISSLYRSNSDITKRLSRKTSRNSVAADDGTQSEDTDVECSWRVTGHGIDYQDYSSYAVEVSFDLRLNEWILNNMCNNNSHVFMKHKH